MSVHCHHFSLPSYKYIFLTNSSLQTFKNPKPAVLALLRQSGPVPGDENGVKSKRAAAGEESVKKKKRVEKNVSIAVRMSVQRISFLSYIIVIATRSIWTSWQTVFRDLERMTFFKSYRWSMTIRLQILTPRMMLNVCPFLLSLQPSMSPS